MTNITNILDFDDNGRAIIEIPRIQDDYSFVLNHWQNIECQLDEIEEDLLCSDTEGRRRFLKKTKKLLLEYREKLEESEEYDESYSIEELKECGYDEKEIEEFLNGESEEDEIDEVELKLSKANIHLDVVYDSEEGENYLCVYHFQLKHSLAWYLMNRLDHEIVMVEQQIKKMSGLLKIYDSEDNLDKAITIMRQSNCPMMARNGLMEEFQLSEIQSEHILSMKLRELTGMIRSQILQVLEYYAAVKSLLIDLKG